MRFGGVYGPTPNTSDKPALVSLTYTPDIHSIMVNRWNYGYAYELTSQAPAINEAYRAVQDLPG